MPLVAFSSSSPLLPGQSTLEIALSKSLDIGNEITYIATKKRTKRDISKEELDSELENDSEANSNSGSEKNRYEKEEEKN
jgi:hypothetical protein